MFNICLICVLTSVKKPGGMHISLTPCDVIISGEYVLDCPPKSQGILKSESFIVIFWHRLNVRRVIVWFGQYTDCSSQRKVFLIHEDQFRVRTAQNLGRRVGAF